MNEAPPIYGATANAWSDALAAEGIKRDHSLSNFLIGVGAFFVAVVCLYPPYAWHTKSVSDWHCPPQSVLAKQTDPLEKTWVTRDRRYFGTDRVQMDCRSFSPQIQIREAKAIITRNWLSMMIWAIGLLGGAISVRFGRGWRPPWMWR
jgi:hypothetical protein